MALEVIMPKAGVDMTEGQIVQWNKKVGEFVKEGEILGVHIIGPAAAELINEASSIIEMEITVEEMLKTIHGHPTYSEVMYEAFADVLGMAIHSPKKK